MKECLGSGMKVIGLHAERHRSEALDEMRT